MAKPPTRLSMTVTPECIPAFFYLISQGFQIKVVCGGSIKDLLCDQIGLDENYVEERIQTVFLNGRAVDNLNKAIITEDSTLALSAAMPGIAGATMRRSGRYSAMRGQISHENNAQRSGSRTGKLTLKLFNLIAKELGPDFLCKGIWLKGSYFKDFILTQSNSFWEDCGECRLNERPSDKASLLSTEWDESDFFLKLQVKK